MSIQVSAARRTTQVAVAAVALTVMGTGIALACSSPHKTPAPVVKHCNPAPKPSPKPSCPPKATPTPKPTSKSCPPESTPTPTPAPTPVVTPTPTPQVLGTPTQATTLPDTGSSFGGSTIGLGSMITAGVAYARSRKYRK